MSVQATYFGHMAGFRRVLDIFYGTADPLRQFGKS